MSSNAAEKDGIIETKVVNSKTRNMEETAMFLPSARQRALE